MAETFADQLAVEEVGLGEYISKTAPGHMGNINPIAYGGCTLAIAIRAASATVPPTHSLYSVVGHYLGPASTTEKLLCTVHATRNSRSFATRRVEVNQKQRDGSTRKCAEMLMDFHVQEPALLTFSTPPRMQYSGPEKSLTIEQSVEAAVSKGLIGEEYAAVGVAMFSMLGRFFDSRSCPEGMSTQNLTGALKDQPTTQDALPVTSRTSADWGKTVAPLTSAGEKAAALAFHMDGGLAFLPLAHSHLFFDDAGVCSSLDFALRIFVPEVDLGKWHLRERVVIEGGHGRTYTEGRLWDDQGRFVASMTQQGILRPIPGQRAEAKI
jgi:acyl-CoA thioesterase II